MLSDKEKSLLRAADFMLRDCRQKRSCGSESAAPVITDAELNVMIKALAQFSAVQAEREGAVAGWKWMSHPSRRNGEPIPVKVWEEPGYGLVYLPFNEQDDNFLIWDQRSPEWVEHTTPQASATVPDGYVSARALEWLLNPVNGLRLAKGIEIELRTALEFASCSRPDDSCNETNVYGLADSAEWLRNNYQAHATISDLCDAMIAAGKSTPMAEQAKDAARYRWLRRHTSAHGVIDGWAFGFPTHLNLPAPVLAMTSPSAGLDAAIDAMLASQPDADKAQGVGK